MKWILCCVCTFWCMCQEWRRLLHKSWNNDECVALVLFVSQARGCELLALKMLCGCSLQLTGPKIAASVTRTSQVPCTLRVVQHAPRSVSVKCTYTCTSSRFSCSWPVDFSLVVWAVWISTRLIMIVSATSCLYVCVYFNIYIHTWVSVFHLCMAHVVLFFCSIFNSLGVCHCCVFVADVQCPSTDNCFVFRLKAL